MTLQHVVFMIMITILVLIPFFTANSKTRPSSVSVLYQLFPFHPVSEHFFIIISMITGLALTILNIDQHTCRHLYPSKV